MTDLAVACGVVLEAAERRGHGVALVGGFAVSVRTEPRFTRDVDLVVAVDDGQQAEAASDLIVQRGFGWGRELRRDLETLQTSRPPHS